MAQPAEFEEKEYEEPLNFELLFDQRNKLWSPGQSLEKYFGFDCALLASHPEIFRLHGHRYIPTGVALNDFRWGHVWRKVGNKRPLPNFRTNLFLQTKRPHHRVGKNTQYASYGITGEYWLFETMMHQQRALEQLSNRLRNRALVCYACAAFHTLTELFNHIDNNSLVDNSTFVQVHKISGHEKWVYNRPGTTGLACSEIEYNDGPDFREILNTIAGEFSSDEDPLQNLLELEAGIVEITRESNAPISIQLRRRREILYEVLRTWTDLRGVRLSSRNNNAARAFFTVTTFCNLTNTDWFLIGL